MAWCSHHITSTKEKPTQTKDPRTWGPPRYGDHSMRANQSKKRLIMLVVKWGPISSMPGRQTDHRYRRLCRESWGRTGSARVPAHLSCSSSERARLLIIRYRQRRSIRWPRSSCRWQSATRVEWGPPRPSESWAELSMASLTTRSCAKGACHLTDYPLNQLSPTKLQIKEKVRETRSRTNNS